MKLAWIEHNTVRDIASGNPAELYHPALAALYDTEVPDTTVNGATLVDGEWVNLVPQPSVNPAQFTSPDRRITKLAFRNRFTPAEKAALEIAQLDDPASPMLQRAQAAALRANQADVAAATFIDLDRPDTRAGVQALEAAGLLAARRALEILDAPVLDAERYLG